MGNGLAIYVPAVQTQTHCDVNYANWPFGEQNCTFTAGSWTYDMTQVDIQPYLSFDQLGGTDSNDTPLDFEHFLHKSKFEITGNQYERNEGISLLPRREISQHDNVLPIQNETQVYGRPADDSLNESNGCTEYLDFRPRHN